MPECQSPRAAEKSRMELRELSTGSSAQGSIAPHPSICLSTHSDRCRSCCLESSLGGCGSQPSQILGGSIFPIGRHLQVSSWHSRRLDCLPYRQWENPQHVNQPRRSKHIQKVLQTILALVLLRLQVSDHGFRSTWHLAPKPCHYQKSFRLLRSTLKPTCCSDIRFERRWVSIPWRHQHMLVTHGLKRPTNHTNLRFKGLKGLPDRCSPGYYWAPRVAPLPCTTICRQHTANETRGNRGALLYLLIGQAWTLPATERPAVTTELTQVDTCSSNHW